MKGDRPSEDEFGAGVQFDVRWADVFRGFAASVVVTAVLTVVVLLVDKNVWWVSIGSVLALLIGGSVAGFSARQIEPLNGALLACVFFGVEAAILMFGTALEGTFAGLPDPLPGLAIGDSTFFFVSPLGQLVAAVSGSVIGGGWAEQRMRPALKKRDDSLSAAVDSGDEPEA